MTKFSKVLALLASAASASVASQSALAQNWRTKPVRIETGFWFGLLAPTGMSKEVVAKIEVVKVS